MDSYLAIEALMAQKYGQATTTRKAIDDFMLSPDHCRKRQKQ